MNNISYFSGFGGCIIYNFLSLLLFIIVVPSVHNLLFICKRAWNSIMHNLTLSYLLGKTCKLPLNRYVSNVLGKISVLIW